MQRSLLIFENSVKSLASRKTYLYYIDKFISDFDLKYYDDLASVPQDKLQIMVEYFVMDFKKKKKFAKHNKNICIGIESVSGLQ